MMDSDFLRGQGQVCGRPLHRDGRPVQRWAGRTYRDTMWFYFKKMVAWVCSGSRPAPIPTPTPPLPDVPCGEGLIWGLAIAYHWTQFAVNHLVWSITMTGVLGEGVHWSSDKAIQSRLNELAGWAEADPFVPLSRFIPASSIQTCAPDYWDFLVLDKAEGGLSPTAKVKYKTGFVSLIREGHELKCP